MPTAWIQRLTKGELTEALRRLNIDYNGTVDELRKRLRHYYSDHPTEMEEPPHDPVTGPFLVNTAGLPPTGNTATDPRVASHRTVTPDTATIMSQLRKWGCVFDGKDPVAFLERLDELSTGYGYPGEYLLRGLPELLKGESLLWYRNNRDYWQNWGDFESDFRRQFLPRRYLEQLRRDTQSRLQLPGEPYGKYETAMLTMLRRAGGFGREDQIARIYENLRPEYKFYVRYDDLHSIHDLRCRAMEYEAIVEQCRKTSVPSNEPTPATQRNGRTERPANTATARKPAVAAATYEKTLCCWRCKQRGHTRSQCRQPARKFCSQCGQDGVLTRECHPWPGNLERVEASPAAPRP